MICRRCERWNLTPLEARWEAIDEAERLYRAARLRIATENIGLARLREGLELVRIGAPPQLELAGWRYGDQFGRRRRKYIALTALGVLATCAPFFAGLGGPVLVVAGGAALAHHAIDIRKNWRHSRVPTVFLPDGAGGLLPLTVQDAWGARLVPAVHSADWHVRVVHRVREPVAGQRGRLPQAAEPVLLRGVAAQQALARLLPHASPTGGSRRGIREALSVIESANSLDQLVYSASMFRKHAYRRRPGNYLTGLPARLRLALEMAVHDENERRALEGELAELEKRWQDAEQIASIADALLVPADTETRLESLRQSK